MRFAPIASLALALFVSVPAIASADSVSVDFESYSLGTINSQDGWSSLGAAGSGCAAYDHAVASNTGPAEFGAQSLRISNAVASGCFGDQTFSKSLADEAGEMSAQNGSLSGGSRQTHFEAQWSFISADPSGEQSGLSVVASPDRGDGARMSWVQMADTPTGIDVNFYDYQHDAANFVQTPVATGLDRTAVHTIKITIDFLDGAENDVVRVYVDGSLAHTGTSWEDYFRDQESNPTRTVDSILFRTSTAAPATAGKGFFIDNLSLSSSARTAPGLVTVDDDFAGHAVGTPEGSLTYGVDAFATIAEALNAVANGGTITVLGGTYAESPSITKSVTLQTAENATISGQITISAPSVTVSGFTINNPNGNFGILINHVDNATVLGNTVSNIGTGTASGNVYGIYFQDEDSTSNAGLTVMNNTISSVGNTTNGSNGGIGVGDSTGSGAITGVIISGNTVSGITANTTPVSPGKGAYGIILNHAKKRLTHRQHRSYRKRQRYFEP